jgi:hypothetical protein
MHDGHCDVCNEEASLESGTCYTAEEFRKLVSNGFGPDGEIIRAALQSLAEQAGQSEQAAIDILEVCYCWGLDDWLVPVSDLCCQGQQNHSQTRSHIH